MEKSKKITNILLVVIVILVIVGCVLAYFYFTKDKTKPIINPEERSTIQNQEKIFTVENYPKIDGSTATLPLAEAFKANFTGIDIKDVDVTHSKTHNAYVNLINGNTDLILVTYPSVYPIIFKYFLIVRSIHHLKRFLPLCVPGRFPRKDYFQKLPVPVRNRSSFVFDYRRLRNRFELSWKILFSHLHKAFYRD